MKSVVYTRCLRFYYRSDTILQSLVYKVIPGLYDNEVERRTAYEEKLTAAGENSEQHTRLLNNLIGFGLSMCHFKPTDLISLCLEYSENGDWCELRYRHFLFIFFSFTYYSKVLVVAY